MKRIIAILIVAIIVLISCGKKSGFEETTVNGVTQYKNTDIPSDPNAKLDLKKLYTISTEDQSDSTAFFKRPISLSVDKDENLYVLDLLSMSVKKFDKTGGFVKSISRQGRGPGELFYPSVMFIDNDTLKVMSIASRKISKFDLDGNFYKDVMIDQMQLQNTKMSPNGQRMVTFLTNQIDKGEGQQPDLEFSLVSMDRDSMKVNATLHSTIISLQDLMAGKMDFNDLMIPFSPGDDIVYVSENSDAQYRIFAYDYNGDKKSEIRKSFKKIRYGKVEKGEYREELKKMAQGIKNIKVSNFKKAISNIHTDKYGRLLIVPSIDRKLDAEGVYIDIFKDGKFLNRVEYNIMDKMSLGILSMAKSSEYFIGDKLYVMNIEELTIDVYDY
ncbi:MAG: 6-bladed beta-propeller [Candidatus Delongbacteria bacterium]|nr:6-bladed beta-propeller [Candidatus Delongbacteria bacterium]